MSQSTKYALTTLCGPAVSRSCACAAVTGPAIACPTPNTSADAPASRRLLRNMRPPLFLDRDRLTFAEPGLSVKSLNCSGIWLGWPGATRRPDHRAGSIDRLRSDVDRHVPARVPGTDPALPR